MSTEENRRVTLQWVECIAEGRDDDLFAITAPEGTWWVSGLKETSAMAGTYTFTERKDQLKKIFAGKKSFELPIKGVTAEGDTVVVEALIRVETEDARTYANDIIFKFVVKDGKVQSLREYVDLVPLLKFKGAYI